MIAVLLAGSTGCERRPRSLEGTIGPLSYRSVGNAIEITGCEKTKTGTVTIPSTIAGLPVTKIGHGAFLFTRVKKVVIPIGVKEIRQEAFYVCRSLESVELPNSLELIGERAFYRCTDLESVEFPNSLKRIGERAFFGCTDLESVEFPNSLELIGERAFYECTGLESVEFPNSLKRIGERAFYSCSKLSEVSLPDNVRTMEKGVFKSCRALTKIDLPANLEAIHEGAFEGCGITSLVIPGKVTQIDARAFDCRQLKHAHLPKNIPKIADHAFGFGKALEKVTIDASPITYPPEILNPRMRRVNRSQTSIKKWIEQRRSREEKALSFP